MRHKRHKYKLHKKYNSKHKSYRRSSSAASFWYKANKFVRRHPIFSSIGSILLSILLIRISFLNTLFGNNISEFRLWFLFLALLIGIVGIFALKVWFRNHVSNFNVQTNLKWRP